MSLLDSFFYYWKQFAIKLSLTHDKNTSIYSILLSTYTESQRYYHTVQHIVECLQLFHQIKHQLQDPIAVELAIWFHDVIYDPKASDNEEQSAELMQKLCTEIVGQAQIQKVYRWIIATKKHQPSLDSDLNYLLDIDLAILGSDSNRFAEYEQQIQQEYSWVEPSIYKIKRAEVLQYFYAMQPLYQTEYFRESFEKKAKHNLTSVNA